MAVNVADVVLHPGRPAAVQRLAVHSGLQREHQMHPVQLIELLQDRGRCLLWGSGRKGVGWGAVCGAPTKFSTKLDEDGRRTRGPARKCCMLQVQSAGDSSAICKKHLPHHCQACYTISPSGRQPLHCLASSFPCWCHPPEHGIADQPGHARGLGHLVRGRVRTRIGGARAVANHLERGIGPLPASPAKHGRVPRLRSAKGRLETGTGPSLGRTDTQKDCEIPSTAQRF